ncbi:hypothetical protein ACO0QE_000216 [Hanseniaspora vineae]
MNNDHDQLDGNPAEIRASTNEEQETNNEESNDNFQLLPTFYAQVLGNNAPEEVASEEFKRNNEGNNVNSDVSREIYRRMQLYDYCMGYSNTFPDENKEIDLDADFEASQSGEYPRVNTFFSGYFEIDILKFDFALRLLKDPKNVAQDVGPHFFVATQVKHHPFENSHKRVLVDVPEFDTDELKKKILEKEEAAEMFPSLKVRQLASNVSIPHWKSGDTFPISKCPSYKNNLAVMYKGFFISIDIHGPATILIAKPEYGYSKVKLSDRPDFFQRRKIEHYTLIEDKYSFTPSSRGLPWAPHSKALTFINYMRVCQLFGRAKLFVCVGSGILVKRPDNSVAAQKNGSHFQGDGCMIFDMEEMLSDAFPAETDVKTQKSLRRKADNLSAMLKAAEYSNKNGEAISEDFQPDIIFETSQSVWSCDTYSGEDFDVVVLGTNEHMVRVYYASTALTETGMFAKKFYKSFAIPVYSNVPTLQLSKSLLPSGNLMLTVGTVGGDVHTIELDINDEKRHIQDFLSKLEITGADEKNEILNTFLLTSAVCKGKYILLDTQNLRNTVWTITPLDGKTDFAQVESWKSLTNSELPDFHAEKELICIQTEYLLGRGIAPHILESDNYNVGALLTTVAVPTMALSSKFWCNSFGGVGYAKNVFSEMIRFENANQNNPLHRIIFAREDLGLRLITVGGHEYYLEDCYNDYLDDDIEVNERSKNIAAPRPQSLLAVGERRFSKLNKKQEEDDGCDSMTIHCTPFEKKELVLPKNTLHNEYYEKSFRRWPENIGGVSDEDMTNLQKFFYAPEELLGSGEFIWLKEYFLKIFVHIIRDTLLFSSFEPFLEDFQRAKTSDFGTLKMLLFFFKRFEDEYLRKDPMTWVRKVLDASKGSETPPVSFDFIPTEISWEISEMKDLFTQCQRSKLGRLYGYELTSLDSMETKLADDSYFLVTTKSALYLLYGHPLLVKAYTSESIFPLAHKSFANHKILQYSNRLSIVVHIKELCAVAVASQIGLVSIMRLVEYKGVKSFRQECILGLEFLTRFDETVEQYVDTAKYANSAVPTRGRDYELQSKSAHIAFPMATIIGMTYEMLSESFFDRRRYQNYLYSFMIPKILSTDNKTVLIVAHGSSVRSLLKIFCNISEEDIKNVDIPNGIPLVVELKEDFTFIRRYYLDPKQAKINAEKSLQRGVPMSFTVA